MKIINVMASSVDSFIAAKPIESDEERQQIKISSKEDYEYLLETMKDADAIIVGASSIRANGECLELTDSTNPHWYILAQSELEADMHFWKQDKIKRTVVSTNTLPIYNESVNSMFFTGLSSLDMTAELMEHLKKQNFKKVLLFGGGEVNSWFYELSYVDELALTLAPVIVASESGSNFVNPKLSQPVPLSLLDVKQKAGFLFLRYQVSKDR